ncbi:hypothetical protein SAMN04490202_1620 [Pseudomonas reinekei]|jgi:hypothetical protein|uniref:Lipoprotein n=1 Tax=Pseudomonas reinekei TaxID=395598 RepID=A0A1H0LSJ2_PSERE|nr:hypothetical protein SAMN04490202_1620 [Pseudomonas reinekei]
MSKHLFAPLLLAVAVALGGSSCHDSSQDDQARPPMNSDSGRIIPPQQRMPSTLPRPRM